MSVRLDLLKDMNDLAVRSNEEGGALDSHYLLAVHILLFHHAILVRDLLVRIGEQWVGKFVLVLEFLLGCRRVGGNAQYRETGLL
jgi:hypothetical protein